MRAMVRIMCRSGIRKSEVSVAMDTSERPVAARTHISDACRPLHERQGRTHAGERAIRDWGSCCFWVRH